METQINSKHSKLEVSKLLVKKLSNSRISLTTVYKKKIPASIFLSTYEQSVRRQ